MYPSTYKRCKVASTATRKKSNAMLKRRSCIGVTTRKAYIAVPIPPISIVFLWNLDLTFLDMFRKRTPMLAQKTNMAGIANRLAGFAAPFSAMGANSVEIKLRDQSYPTESGESEVPPG